MSSADAIGPAAPLPESGPPPADAFSGLIDRATSRLGSDSDLRLEIAQELRGHLQDSAAEYRAAGLSEAEAAAKAAQAMGDPSALADQLWHANRGRMRRRAVVSWAFGVLAAPVVIAICFSVVWGVVTSLSLLSWIEAISARHPAIPIRIDVGTGLTRRAWARLVESVPPEDRIAIDDQDLVGAGRTESRIARARQFADRFPTDPVYAANLVTQTLLRHAVFNGPKETDPAALQELLAALDRGAAVDPDNGYYPLIRAAALMDVSSRPIEEPDENKPQFDYTDPAGKVQQEELDRIEVTDPATFQHGLAAFHEAARKPFIKSRALEIVRRQSERFPAPAALNDYLLETSYGISTLIPYANVYRHAANLASGYAVARAAHGRAVDTERVVEDGRRVGLLITASPEFIVEARVGEGVTTMAMAERALIDKLLSSPEAFAHSRAAYEERRRRLNGVWRAPVDPGALETARRHAGLVQSATAFDLTAVDLAPGRRAEYAAVDAAALSLLVLALLIAAGARVALLAVAAVMRRRSGSPPPARPFIGWRRVARVVLLGGVLPLAAYGAYCYLPISGRSYGLPTTGLRVLVEYAMVGAVVALLLGVLTERAVGQRLIELGLSPVTRRRSKRAWVACAMLGVATLASLIAWQAHVERAGGERSVVQLAVPLVLAACAAAFAGAQLGEMPLPGRRRRKPAGASVETGGATNVRDTPPAGPLWRRRYPGSILAVLALLTGVCLWLGLREAPHSQAAQQTFFLAAGIACGLAMLGWGAIRFTTTLRAVARPGARGQEPATTPSTLVSHWQAAARSAAVTYAATALVAGVAGTAVLRAQERHAVRQFDRAGYSIFGEMEHGRPAQERAAAVSALRESSSTTLPNP
jgi:hypothetical protein